MIQEVVKKNLCTQCGVCAGICPVEAISMIKSADGEIFPQVSDKCIKCGACLKVCPGHEVDFEELNKDIFSVEGIDLYLGYFKHCYTAQSADKKVFESSTSGGVVTQLCLNLLSQKKVNGIIMVRDGKDPLYPEVFIARNRKDILSAMKSKYVSAPVGQILTKIRKSRGKYAVVGLPCQMHGIRKAEQLDSALKKRIALHIGIFCAYLPQREYLKWFAVKSGVELSKVQSISFRSGWPGKLVFHADKDIEFPKEEFYYFPLTLPFINPRCLKCTDQVNELADIGVGDAWHISDTKQAVVIDRKGILSNTLRKDLLLNEISPDDVKKSQRQQLWMKKEGYRARMVSNPPEYVQQFPIAGFSDFFKNFLIYGLVFMRRLGIFQRLPKSTLKKFSIKITRN